MSFQIVESDRQDFIQYKGFIKNNNGLFKSPKQAQFLFSRITKGFSDIWSRESFQNNYGIEVAPDQAAFILNAYMQWSDYGSRGTIPLLYIFVVDRAGVVSHYKMGGNGNLRDGWAPNKEKLSLIWKRPDTVQLPEITVAEEPIRPSEWLGQVGDKVTVNLKFIRGRDMGWSRFGPMYLSVFEDTNGSVVNIWKQFNFGAGDTVCIQGTIKSTDVYRDRKQTTLTRVKVL